MTPAPRRIGLYLLVWLGLLIIAGVFALLLQRQHEANVQVLLDQALFSQQVSWQAIEVQQQNSVLPYYEELVREPDTLALLSQAQNASARPRVRTALLQRLSPAFQRLASRGVRLVHFHLPDGTSLLRLHEPERYGDSLIPARASVRLANQELVPVHSFEVAGLVAAYRNVFPIMDETGAHLGSVDFSLPFDVLIEALTMLAPDRTYQFVLDRAVREAAVSDGLSEDFQRWPGSDRFVLPTTPGSETNDSVAENIGQSPALETVVEQREARALRLHNDGVDYLVTLLPMMDPAGELIGLLLSQAQEPELARMDRAFRINLGLSMAAVLLLGLGVQYGLGVTARNASERERLDLITRSLGQGMYVLDARGVITDVNPRACTLLGFDRREMIGRKAHELFHHHIGEERDKALPCPILAATARGERYAAEQHFRRQDGRKVDVSVTSVPLREQEGSVTLFDDITRQKENERKLHHIAHYDALTGLPNRVLLADRLALAMARARRSGTPLALAFIDLDGFKAVNDTHGHDIGDRLLVRLARRMQECVRETDTVARLGGDEFAVVLSDMEDTTSYAASLDRLLVALNGPEKLDGKTLQLSASIGVTTYPQTLDIDADQLLRQSDQAMYQAKLAGKNRYRLFDVDHDSDLRGRHEQVERIRQALEDGELVLYFQPKVNMRSGKVIGAEALIRWHHPERGLLTPSAFLPLISRHALELELGRWVIRRALQHMSAWQRNGLSLPVSVNVAGDHIQHPEFVADLTRELHRHSDVAPSRLQLEVVESSALEDIGAVSNVIGECALRGVDVALDDFGTGYSSLTYLKRLPVRVLKLDQSFVRDMLHDPEDLAILDGVLNLARAFALETIAEGVSSLEHGRVLLQLGCEIAQGYVIARPMPASGVPDWVRSWRLPKQWQDARRLDHAALELLYAEVEYRAWARDLVAYCKGELDVPPLLDPRQSRLGPKLRANPLIKQAPECIEQIGKLHDRIQALGAEMVRIRDGRDAHAALARLPEIEALLAQLLDILRQQAATERRPQFGS